MKIRTLSGALFTLTLLPVFASGCSSDPEANGPNDGSGGAPGSGGITSASGGMSSSGGAPASGGMSSSGGDVASGGQVSGDGDGDGSGSVGNGSGGDDSGTSSGGAGSGGSSPTGSEGCGMETGQAAGSWVASNVSNNRKYDVRLPANYDDSRAYPVILLLHGCGDATNNVPVEREVGEDAIVIRGTGTDGTCWFAGPNGADMPYIDEIIADVQARFCVNAGQLFAVGYSSGSWLASSLSCHRGDVFRGIATVTGGEPTGISNCKGQVGRIFVHDNMDNDNRIGGDTPSRDRMITTNKCTTTTMPVDPSPCVEYQGCDAGYPVIWCETTGKGHSRQDELAPAAFWNFFQSLME